MPIPANLTISCPGLPGLATGGGDGPLSAQCPATAAPDGVCTSANPHASGSAACAVPAAAPASPSPDITAAAAIISRRPRLLKLLIHCSPVIGHAGQTLPRSPQIVIAAWHLFQS